MACLGGLSMRVFLGGFGRLVRHLKAPVAQSLGVRPKHSQQQVAAGLHRFGDRPQEHIPLSVGQFHLSSQLFSTQVMPQAGIYLSFGLCPVYVLKGVALILQ